MHPNGMWCRSAGLDCSALWHRFRHHCGMAWTMRLPKDEEAALDAQADSEGRSKHEITRDAIRAYLERRRGRTARGVD
ncbi:ribbon-helix-helix protein, CopG family [Nocardia amamiensis]